MKILDFILNGVQEAAGSNPVTRTNLKSWKALKTLRFQGFFVFSARRQKWRKIVKNSVLFHPLFHP
nr:MAG TPA: hypothetical protein [Caudoviricetes sp.]